MTNGKDKGETLPPKDETLPPKDETLPPKGIPNLDLPTYVRKRPDFKNPTKSEKGHIVIETPDEEEPDEPTSTPAA